MNKNVLSLLVLIFTISVFVAPVYAVNSVDNLREYGYTDTTVTLKYTIPGGSLCNENGLPISTVYTTVQTGENTYTADTGVTYYGDARNRVYIVKTGLESDTRYYFTPVTYDQYGNPVIGNTISVLTLK